MVIVTLLLGVSLAGMRVELGDAVMQAQFDLMKLSYACSDPLYRTKRESTRRSIAHLESYTTFRLQDVADLDNGLKNGTIELNVIDKGDCIKLLADAQKRVDELVGEYDR